MSGFDVLAILALGFAIGSIALRYWETPPELIRRMAALELDMANQNETSTRWMKRENVRRARDEKEAAPDLGPALNGSSNLRDRKAEIRARIRARQ